LTELHYFGVVNEFPFFCVTRYNYHIYWMFIQCMMYRVTQRRGSSFTSTGSRGSVKGWSFWVLQKPKEPRWRRCSFGFWSGQKDWFLTELRDFVDVNEFPFFVSPGIITISTGCSMHGVPGWCIHFFYILMVYRKSLKRLICSHTLANIKLCLHNEIFLEIRWQIIFSIIESCVW